GVMVSGGSQANLIAMMSARHRKVGDCKQKGLQGKTLVAYVSDQAHYSSQRAANLLGIGLDNLIAIKTDDDGKLIPEELELQIKASLQQARTPFYIGVTSGTTVIGAFDPIKPCSRIAKEYDCWLHVDGAWGAPVLFSKKHRYLMQDVALADSASWDSHKLMSVPLTASGIQVREAGQLKSAISGGGGEYLFHNDENAAFNMGEHSLQCGRKADALKVWMGWKAVGSKGFAQKVEHLQELKEYCVERLNATDCFTLLAPAAYLNILFRYEPEGKPLNEEALSKLNIAICTKLKKEGSAFIDYARYKGHTGIRLILGNGDAKQKDIDRVIKHCQRAGEFLSNR
ncbi:MAG TPA: aminotransferase class V-fold PLP-dependent enzyme, partial [Ghiorsea sp.]|nr:aminotransferase class V-fold PLP-dependent enzyme [Ghiorsea sp.]